MIGWGACTKASPRTNEKALTLISEEAAEEQKSPLIKPVQAQTIRADDAGKCPLQKLKLTPPPISINIMPRTRR